MIIASASASPRAVSHGRAIALFLTLSFVLHVLWENLQAPLYKGYISFVQHAGICLKAAFGDMIFMGILYGMLALLHRDVLWIANPSAYARPSMWIVTVLAGFLFAVSFEFWALSTHRWEYDAMPTILGIGVFPVLQMIAIPLITLSLSRFLSRL